MQKIKDYELLLDLKNREISLLKFKLENFEGIQRGKCCECEREAIQDLSDFHFKILPFEDEYFKGLNYEQIAELAKKSIRLTTLNSEIEKKLEKLTELYFLSASKSEELGFSDFKQWFDEFFSYEIYKLIKEK